MQEYIEAKFGSERVILLYIKMEKQSIYHIIRQNPYMKNDIFLFNVRKAETDEDVNYQLLEGE